VSSSQLHRWIGMVHGLNVQHLQSFNKQCVAADGELFKDILPYHSHALHCLLPPPTFATQNNSLGPRTLNRTLPKHIGHLTDSNVLTRALYMKMYWLYCYIHSYFIRVLHLPFDKCLLFYSIYINFQHMQLHWLAKIVVAGFAITYMDACLEKIQ